MAQSKLPIKNGKLFYMYAVLLLLLVGIPRSWFELIPTDLRSILPKIMGVYEVDRQGLKGVRQGLGARGWDKGEGARGWGKGLGQGDGDGARGQGVWARGWCKGCGVKAFGKEIGQGEGASGVARAWGKGLGMGQGGVIYILMKSSTKQVSFVTVRVSERTFWYTFWAEIRDFQGDFPILAGNPHIMTSYSHKNITILQKNSENEICKRFHDMWLCNTTTTRRRAAILKIWLVSRL